jgi:hypothetical protein
MIGKAIYEHTDPDFSLNIMLPTGMRSFTTFSSSQVQPSPELIPLISKQFGISRVA